MGIHAISEPSGGSKPVSMISTATTAKAPTAALQPPSTTPVVASSAAPGVDQATVIGSRVRRDSTIEASPIVIETASRPLPAWAASAPTAVNPVSTTTKELVKATRAETTPAEIGRIIGGTGASAGGSMPPRTRSRRGDRAGQAWLHRSGGEALGGETSPSTDTASRGRLGSTGAPARRRLSGDLPEHQE